MYTSIVRPLLFAATQGDPERAHSLALMFLRSLQASPCLLEHVEAKYGANSPALERTLLGMTFSNPIGLAAGFDKNAVALPALQALGFGFLEVGTVLPDPGQGGNPRPRVFRLPENEALINRMGFNNKGASYMERRLRKWRKKGTLRVPIGINLGKLKDTPLDRAHEDYCKVFDQLYYLVDYLVVNVSSPNTPSLRRLQDQQYLTNILRRLHVIRDGKMSCGLPWKPILVKIDVDLDDLEKYNEMLEVIGAGADGLICSNTTMSRKGLVTTIDEVGGLSGRPLHERAVARVAYSRKQLPNMPIIGIGGVFDYDGYRRMTEEAGADLVALYTGFIFRGPSLPKEICERIANEALLQQDVTSTC